jgi:hypothetical protein
MQYMPAVVTPCSVHVVYDEPWLLWLKHAVRTGVVIVSSFAMVVVMMWQCEVHGCGGYDIRRMSSLGSAVIVTFKHEPAQV